MTISTQQSSQIFLGNGVTTAFDFSFVGDSSSFITVTYTDSDGNATVLASSQYTIVLNPAAVGSLWGVGGTVTYPKVGSPITVGTSLTVARILPLTQEDSISNQGAFAPSVIESALDTLMMQIQQTSDRSGLFRGTWTTGITYNFGDYVVDGVNGSDTGNYYFCVLTNISTVWVTDLAAGDWVLAINVQGISDFAVQAAASAASASTSASSASTSASNAANSASNASISASSASASASSASTSASSASTSASSAAASVAALTATSTSSVTIGSGAKTFTTQSEKLFTSGQFLVISSNATPTNFMHGNVTSYSGTSLVMNITDTGGSGTLSDWNIAISGTQGPSASFGMLSGGTNTSAAMILGSGASMATAGSGTITATGLTTAGITTLLALVYPIGSYYFNETDNTNPATLFGFGAWSAVTDKFIVGHGSTYTSTGGAATSTISANNLPALDVAARMWNSASATAGNSFTNTTSVSPGTSLALTPTVSLTVTGAVNAGSANNPISIIPPYQAAYIWKRTA